MTARDVTKHNDALVIAEKLLEHLNVKHHPYTLGACAIARWVLQIYFEDEDEMEECIIESCKTFYECTLDYSQELGERDQQMLWQTSVALGVAIYGADRALECSKVVFQEFKEFNEEIDDSTPPFETRTIN